MKRTSELRGSGVELSPVRVVCISDTHNQRPTIPPGDVLIHAGDLTDHGTFLEVQSGLDWLAEQPHAHKILIAGNHDLLLDEDYMRQARAGLPVSRKTLHDLSWPDGITYLNQSSVTLKVSGTTKRNLHVESTSGEDGHAPVQARTLKIFGSPYSVEFSASAFKYPSTDCSFWKGKIPQDADIVVTHGPPKLHLDDAEGESLGCPFLAREIARVRPRLHVFGHVHEGHGKEDVVFNAAQRSREEFINFIPVAGERWRLKRYSLASIKTVCAAWQWLDARLFAWLRRHEASKITTMVNASVVSRDDVSDNTVLSHQATVVDI